MYTLHLHCIQNMYGCIKCVCLWKLCNNCILISNFYLWHILLVIDCSFIAIIWAMLSGGSKQAAYVKLTTSCENGERLNGPWQRRERIRFPHKSRKVRGLCFGPDGNTVQSRSPFSTVCSFFGCTTGDGGVQGRVKEVIFPMLSSKLCCMWRESKERLSLRVHWRPPACPSSRSASACIISTLLWLDHGHVFSPATFTAFLIRERSGSFTQTAHRTLTAACPTQPHRRAKWGTWEELSTFFTFLTQYAHLFIL